jgi:outer membrane receptor protein involved in Fe transport
LPQAIAELSREAGASIGTEGALPNLRTPALHGRLTVEAALGLLLRGSGFIARRVGPNAWRIERAAETPTEQAPDSAAVVTPPEPEIIVRATKRDLTLQNAPVAATVVVLRSSEQADPANGSRSLAERTEGLALAGQADGHNRLFLRGVADSAFGGKSQATVAVVLDDARLTYVAPDPDIRLVDVARVELLKGPQGSLYGTGALGGIYRIVTNEADPGGFSVAGSVGAEAVAGGELGASGSLILNVPLVRDVAALRLVGYAEKTPGWLDTGTRKDSNGTEVAGVRGKLGVDAGGGWHVDATGLGQWLHGRDSNYAYRAEASARPAQLPEPNSNDLLHGSLRIAREGATQIVFSSGYTLHDVDERYDATQGAGSFGVPDPQTLDDDSHFRLWDTELRATGRWGHLGWLAGVSHVVSWQHGSRVLNGAAGTKDAVEMLARQATESGLFGETTLPLTDSLDATLGGRLFRAASREDRSTTIEKGTRETVRRGVTPSASLAWHPRHGRLLYLRYGSAVRPGGTTIGEGGTVQTLDEDELRTVEGGWREAIGRFDVDLGLYRSWWRDIQSDVLLSNGLVETANVGNGAITGAELTVKARLGSGGHLDGGAMVQSALLTRERSGQELHDRRLPVVPSWTLRGSLDRSFSVGGWKATASASARYVGPARLSFDPALDRPMGDYLETAAFLEAQRGHFVLRLEGRNLVNSKGDTFAYGNPFRIFTQRQFVRQVPSSARLSVSFVP